MSDVNIAKKISQLALLLSNNSLATTHDRCSRQVCRKCVLLSRVWRKRSGSMPHITYSTRVISLLLFPSHTMMSRLHVLRLFLLPIVITRVYAVKTLRERFFSSFSFGFLFINISFDCFSITDLAADLNFVYEKLWKLKIIYTLSSKMSEMRKCLCPPRKPQGPPFRVSNEKMAVDVVPELGIKGDLDRLSYN